MTAGPASLPALRPSAAAALLALASVLALGPACGGSRNGNLLDPGTGGFPPDRTASGAADGGVPGSDGGDAGSLADAGPCAPFARPISSAYEGCVARASQAATLSRPPTGCGAVLTLPTFRCSGTLSGPFNAFNAFCTGTGPDLFCASASTPGLLNCQQADGGGACGIRVCDTGTCLP